MDWLDCRTQRRRDAEDRSSSASLRLCVRRKNVLPAACVLMVLGIAVWFWWRGSAPPALPDRAIGPITTNSLGMRFVEIPAGEFLMGAPPEDTFAEPDERPAHRVRLTRPFLLGQTEVTQEQYQRVMGSNPSHFSPVGNGRELVRGLPTERFPVEMVSWFDAVRFCEKLSSLPDERVAGRTYRLPTEAEWEYACRAGTTTRFSCGDRLPLDRANVRGGLPRTAAVGSYPANPWGLVDMHGNVLEWCADWHDGGWYAESPVDDPAGPATSVEDVRVLRGGGWFFKAASSSFRDAISPYFRSPAHGLRVVMEMKRP